MSIRSRVTLLTTALMAIVLFTVNVGVYQFLYRSLDEDVNNRLVAVAERYMRSTQPISFDAGQPGLVHPSRDQVQEFFSDPGVYIQVLNQSDSPILATRPNLMFESANSTGQIEATGQSFSWDEIAISDSVLTQNRNGQAVTFTTRVSGTPYRVLSVPLILEGNFLGSIQTVESLSSMQQTIDRLQLFLLTGSVIGMTVTAVGSYLLAGKSLSPLSSITRAAQSVGLSRNIRQPIREPHTGDEVQQLAVTFNAMLERLDSAFGAERRFVSDASHELRTPLTALRGNAEILLRQIESGRIDEDDLQEGLGDIRDEAERMGRLVENLLTLARADVGWLPDLVQTSLDQVARDAARVATPLSRGHEFEVDITPGINVIGDADQLKQLILILLDNAFSYTPDGSEVELNVTTDSSGTANILVRDTGQGMPQEQADRIFDRFYRGDAARNGRSTGAGLGLAIARWIVECHGGTIKVESEPGNGTTVRVSLARDSRSSAIDATSKPHAHSTKDTYADE